MAYDYRLLLLQKESVENAQKQLDTELKATIENKANEKEYEVLTSGRLQEYMELISLVDDRPTDEDCKGTKWYYRYVYETIFWGHCSEDGGYDIPQFWPNDTWIQHRRTHREKNLIGITHTFGSCGEHNGTLVLDVKRSLKENKIIWREAYGTTLYDKVDILCNNSNRLNNMKIKILDFILNDEYFDWFRQAILDRFNKEMKIKLNKVEKTVQEIKDVE